MQVPARLAAGERLYRDVVYCYGPIGPWMGALLFKVFGNRWAALEAMCAAVTVLLLVSLFRLTKLSGSALSATVSVTTAAALCVGAPLGGAFFFPYSIDFLIGLAFGLTALAVALSSSSKRGELLAALCLVIALGTRIELGAAVAAILVLSGWRWSGNEGTPGREIRVACWGLLGAIVVYAVAFAGVPLCDLSPEGPGVLFSPPPEWRSVYRLVAGLDAPLRGIRFAVTSFLLDIVVVGAAWVLRKRSGTVSWAALVLVCLVFVSTPAGSAFDSSLPSLFACAPLMAFLLAAWYFVRRFPERAGRARFAMFAFAAVVGSRVLFGLTYTQHSTPFSIFALPLACAVVAVVLLDGGIPADRGFRQNVAVAFLGVALAGLFRLARVSAPNRNLLVTTRVGDLRLPPLQAVPTAMVLHYLETRARPGDTLAGFPEAGIFNFALGMRNPLREEQNLPGDLTPLDETRVIDRLQATRPRFVLLVNQPSYAFGPAAFGQDYDRRLWEVVSQSYSPVASFGTRDLSARVGSQPFFIRVYERIPAAP